MNTKNQISIRKVELNEIEKLEFIARSTFEETFAKDNTKSDMLAYISEKFNREQLSMELNDPHCYFFFAELYQKVVGYLKLNLSTSQTDYASDDAVEIERIYVVGEFHGRGIGKRLFDHAMNFAVEHNKKYIWLGVWEQNTQAIGFY